MKKITVVLLAFMLLVLSGCGGAGKASSFLLDSAGDKLLTVTAETAMVVAGVYESSGRMAGCAVSDGATEPLAARTVDLTLPEPDSDASVKVFFLGANHAPRRDAAVLPVVWSW